MKKKIILFICLIVVVLFSVFASYESITNEIIEDKKTAETAIIAENLNHSTIKQKFMLNTHSIEGIKVQTATFDKEIVGTLKIELIQADQVIASKEISGADILNNGMTDINFNEPIQTDPGVYTIIFDTKELNEETPITFHINKREGVPYLSHDQGVLLNSALNLQYYTHEFSVRRLLYILVSISCLFLYTMFVIRLIRKNK